MEDGIRELFAEYGNVESAVWIMDRDKGRSHGFCFVVMDSTDMIKAAISLS